MDEPAGGEGKGWPGEAGSPAPAARPCRRHLVVLAQDTAESAAACEWALQHLYKEDCDVIHLTYVVQCVQPKVEVFHGMAGTSLSFHTPKDTRKEENLISEAKHRLEARFLPLLRPHLVPYQLHLYAERVDAGLKQVAELLLQDIEQRDAALVILSAHNKPGTQEGMGSIAHYMFKNCRRPLAIVRPHTHGQ